MVERRLQGERWMVPSRIYARPLTLRDGLPLGSAGPREGPERAQVRAAAPRAPGPGQFVVGEKDVIVRPAPDPRRRADEPLLGSLFDKDRVKDVRGLESEEAVRRARPSSPS